MGLILGLCCRRSGTLFRRWWIGRVSRRRRGGVKRADAVGKALLLLVMQKLVTGTVASALYSALQRVKRGHVSLEYPLTVVVSSCSEIHCEGVGLVVVVGLSVSTAWEPFVWRVPDLSWTMLYTQGRDITSNTPTLHGRR